MAANATVAIRTATTVVEFMALFRPSVCILFRRFAIPWTRLRFVHHALLESKLCPGSLFSLPCRELSPPTDSPPSAVLPLLSTILIEDGSALISSSTTSRFCPFDAICSAVCPFLSVRVATIGSFARSALTTCKCPFLAAECRAVLPLLLAMVANPLPASNRKSTISIWPCVAAVCNAVVFDMSTHQPDRNISTILLLNQRIRTPPPRITLFRRNDSALPVILSNPSHRCPSKFPSPPLDFRLSRRNVMVCRLFFPSIASSSSSSANLSPPPAAALCLILTSKSTYFLLFFPISITK
uniref:Uncharacterized protein n=1 Tax=Cucumis melo TaxID=3656 RepID=A0A9I9EKQ5_CUCME